MMHIDIIDEVSELLSKKHGTINHLFINLKSDLVLEPEHFTGFGEVNYLTITGGVGFHHYRITNARYLNNLTVTGKLSMVDVILDEYPKELFSNPVNISIEDGTIEKIAFDLNHKLEVLSINTINIEDVSTYKNLKSLRTLSITGHDVMDISGLSDGTFLRLDLSNGFIRDVNYLATCEYLHTLNISNNEVDRYEELVNCKRLKVLIVCNDFLKNHPDVDLILEEVTIYVADKEGKPVSKYHGRFSTNVLQKMLENVHL